MKGALEPEQRKLLAALVALHRRVPADQRARFRAHHAHQGSFLSHPAAIDWGPVVAVSDLDVLRLTGAISVTGTDDRGRITSFVLPPESVRWQGLKARTGGYPKPVPVDPPYLPRRTLPKQQRNAVYAWLTGTDWDRAAFEWREEERDGELVSRLAHRSSGYFCDFVHVGDMDYEVLFAPGDGAPNGQASASWSDLAAPVRAWLDGLRDEVEAPDLWTLLRREAVLAAGDQDDNAPLSGSEVRTVAERIELARAYLLRSGLVSDQLAEANRKLDYLLAAAPRVGRFDWSNIAIGIVVQIVIAAAFAPDQADRLLETLLGPVRQMLGG